MKVLSEKELAERCKKTLDFEKKGAAALVEKWVSRAEKWLEKGIPTPANVMTFKTVHYDVQLNVVGKFGGELLFSLVDLHDPWNGEPHGYPKPYDGDAEMFYLEIMRELNWIDEIHTTKIDDDGNITPIEF